MFDSVFLFDISAFILVILILFDNFYVELFSYFIYYFYYDFKFILDDGTYVGVKVYINFYISIFSYYAGLNEFAYYMNYFPICLLFIFTLKY